MATLTRWNPGDPVVLRGVWRGMIWFAINTWVVQDSPDLIALYWGAGTPNKIPPKRMTPTQMMTAEQVELVDGFWTETDRLEMFQSGTSHSVSVLWEAGHAGQRCWYVDMLEPWRRTSIGFDTMDHFLDIVISPDCSRWRWKDEDEFAEAIAIGLYSPAQARAIREEGERVIEALRANQPPFCDGWPGWKPPVEWGILGLPEGWNDLEYVVGKNNPRSTVRNQSGCKGVRDDETISKRRGLLGHSSVFTGGFFAQQPPGIELAGGPVGLLALALDPEL
jgi:hypothetical protein